MSLNSISELIKRMRRGPSVRQKFVESQLSKGLAFQIRAMRDRLELSQEELAQRVGMTQNAISRLESSTYGKPTITTLKRLAAAFDVGLIVRFAPFSEMVHWVSGTPYQNKGVSTESFFVPTFEQEDENKIYDSLLVQDITKKWATNSTTKMIPAGAQGQLYRLNVSSGSLQTIRPDARAHQQAQLTLNS